MLRILLFALFFTAFSGFAQKKVIDASVYNDWKRIGDVIVSANGEYSAYTIRPHRGDGYLYIVNNKTGKKDSIARGLEPQFSGNSSYLVFKINPGFDTLRTSELKKVPKDKWPKDTLGIWLTQNDSLIKIPNVKEYRIATESDWLAYLSTTNELPKGYLSKKEKKKEAKKLKKSGPVKTDGKLLTVWRPDIKKPYCYRNVMQFEITKQGSYVAFTEQQKYKKDSVRISVLELNSGNSWKHEKRFTEVNQLTFGTSSHNLVGLYSTDTAEVKRWNAFVFDASTSQWNTFIDTAKHFSNNRVLTNNFKVRLSKDERQVFFGVWDAPEQPEKDTLLESEKVKLDLWHWKEARLQPQQLVELKEDQTESSIHVFHIAEDRFVQVGYDSLNMRLSTKTSNPYVLAIGTEAYEWQTWLSPSPANYYRISTSTGEVLPLSKKTLFGASLSPDGNYFYYFNDINRQLYVRNISSETENCLTCGVNANWFEDMNGMPETAGPRGIIGWTNENNHPGVLFQSERGIWYYDLDGKAVSNFTAGLSIGKADTNYNYNIGMWSTDSAYFDLSNMYLIQFDEQTKAEKTFRIRGTFEKPAFEPLIGSHHHYTGWKKASKGETMLFQRSSVKDYPDLHVLQLDGTASQISHVNPQQNEYNWATVELIEWTSYDGIPLQGLVYKPENFDANKSYPMLVYFYELYSDELHTHYAPKPTASIIHPTEYASAGYVVFIPDIRYKIGHPANSAYDCIMSGTDAVLKKYTNIDHKRLGLQGQSWGGYQTAMLITMTDRYAAAMAGAPVGNMFSAYGGIRWGSGFSRQFQYEHTQSRIGKTIWEAPELYFENSPVFHLPKVKTPLLIMHNDQDGAVPWYQGIEIFTGMRRLGKPVWLLNYNGDDHNLMKNPNRFDLSIRMRQFFDYYLLGQAMPLWLKEGIPALEKGKEFRLETIDN